MLGESEDKVEKLWANVEYLSKGFEGLGFDIGHSETPIIPVRGCMILCNTQGIVCASDMALSILRFVAGDAGRRGLCEGV